MTVTNQIRIIHQELVLLSLVTSQQSGPIRGQYPGHVISTDQSETSDSVKANCWSQHSSHSETPERGWG